MATLKCQHLLEANPVIAAIRNPRDIHAAVDSPCQIVFLLTGNIYNLKPMVDPFNHLGNEPGQNLDGIGFDLARRVKGDIHRGRIQKEKPLNGHQALFARLGDQCVAGRDHAGGANLFPQVADEVMVLRIALEQIKMHKGVFAGCIHEVHKELSLPIITGGFIETEDEVRTCLEAGSLSSSTSHKPLWDAFNSLLAYAKDLRS